MTIMSREHIKYIFFIVHVPCCSSLSWNSRTAYHCNSMQFFSPYSPSKSLISHLFVQACYVGYPFCSSVLLALCIKYPVPTFLIMCLGWFNCLFVFKCFFVLIFLTIPRCQSILSFCRTISLLLQILLYLFPSEITSSK